MIVTMFADASVSPITRKSGWGFWIKGDMRDSMYAGGPLKSFDPSTTVAELEAIANGLSCAIIAGYFRKSDKLLLIQSDSLGALSSILKTIPEAQESRHQDGVPLMLRRRPLTPRELAPAEHIRSLIENIGVNLLLRHIRGHMPGGGRNFVNRLCDRLAKTGRLQASQVLP